MKKQKARSLKNTLNEIHPSMTPAQRILSRAIHTQPVELFLDFVCSVLFRPFTLIFAAIGMIISTILVQYISIYTGFAPYGTEQLIGVCAGYIFGLIIEAICLIKKR